MSFTPFYTEMSVALSPILRKKRSGARWVRMKRAMTDSPASQNDSHLSKIGSSGTKHTFRTAARMFFTTAMLCLAFAQPSFSADKAPAQFNVKVETTKGDFVIEVRRKWAPRGADRFYELVQEEFYNDCRFFRVVPGFMVQWGINGDPKVHKKWSDATIKDDPVVASNLRTFVSFAKSAQPDSRSTQLFINYQFNGRLDGSGFAPFGRVVKGMDVVDSINARHREEPDQLEIRKHGNTYLTENFPDLDYIKSMKVLPKEEK